MVDDIFLSFRFIADLIFNSFLMFYNLIFGSLMDLIDYVNDPGLNSFIDSLPDNSFIINFLENTYFGLFVFGGFLAFIAAMWIWNFLNPFN